MSDFVASCVCRADAHNSGEKVCRSTRANVTGVLPSSVNHFSLPAKQCTAVVRDEARLKHRPLFARVKSTHTYAHTSRFNPWPPTRRLLFPVRVQSFAAAVPSLSTAYLYSHFQIRVTTQFKLHALPPFVFLSKSELISSNSTVLRRLYYFAVCCN